MIQKLKVTEKIGFACGDLGANFVFQFMIALQVTYYVDVFGLAPDTAATMFFVIGIVVAFVNPIMGVIADRTQTKWGKFRPWLIWTAVPFGIIGVLTFTTPDMSPAAKLIYAWVTYGLLRIVYVINNVPYASLNAVISDDPDERNSASQYRQIAANSAGFIVASLVIPLINVFAGGSKNPADLARGYEYTMGILMLVAMVLFVIAFLTTKERVLPDPQQKTSFSQDLADLFVNKAWMILFLVTLFYFTALVMRGNAMFAYCSLYQGEGSLPSWMHGPLFSWVNGFGLASLLIGVACSNWISVRTGKRQLFLISMLLTGILTVVLIFVPPHNGMTVIGLEIARQFSFGISGPVLWSMMGDVADYGEWKTGRRASGTVTAAVVFALWVGLTIGQSLVGWIYGYYGYLAKAVTQTPEAIHGVVLTGGLYAGLAFLVAAALLLIYPLNREENTKIANELAERRKKFVS
ncbi:MAG: MFS transporter [Alphaproteobacteria bacterium]|nr:MFS transporter [Alphaproteobacteria bacterium]MDE1985163.1 MFS transporter [Alphaproteobacteria bacterium]MDE2264269.1 MFS transporter [Alphaproteobacteria bacterium]MDE2499682.1 MFS transporter [Alphaproteobacteria bacterium]